MKRIITLLLALSLLAALCACTAIVPKNDKTYLNNMKKGLEARWKISNSGETFDTTSAFKDNLRDCVNSELNAIGDLSSYTFEDPELAQIAEDYNAALQSQLDGIQYYGSNDAKYDEMFNKNGYNARAIIISVLVEKYEFSVDPSYANTMDDFVNLGRMLTAMQKLITDDLTLECTGGQTYELIIENSTEFDLSGAILNFNLFDSDGVLLETTSAYMESWKAGSKNRASVYAAKEFSSVEMMIQYISNTGSLVETDYSPISFVNNMQIEITLKSSLPHEYSYSNSRGDVYTRCQVTDFSYEADYWNNGKATVSIAIGGKKTYDAEGSSYSRSCHIGWKLYNEKGVVVDSGTFFSGDAKVGESFSGCTAYASDLGAGKYELELLNVS